MEARVPVVVGGPRPDFAIRKVRATEIATVVQFLDDRSRRVLSIVGSESDAAQVVAVGQSRPVYSATRVVWVQAKPSLSGDEFAYLVLSSGSGLAPGVTGPSRYREGIAQHSSDLVVVLTGLEQVLTADRNFLDQSMRSFVRALAESERAKLVLVGSTEARLDLDISSVRLFVDLWSASQASEYLVASLGLSASSLEPFAKDAASVRTYEDAHVFANRIRGLTSAQQPATLPSPIEGLSQTQQRALKALANLQVGLSPKMVCAAMGGECRHDDLLARGVLTEISDNRSRVSRLALQSLDKVGCAQDKSGACHGLAPHIWRNGLTTEDNIAILDWCIPVLTRDAASVDDIELAAGLIRQGRPVLWFGALFDKVRAYWILVAEGAAALADKEALRWVVAGRSNAAQVSMAQGNVAEAVASFEFAHKTVHELLPHSSEHIGELANLGLAYTLAGKFEDSKACWVEIDSLVAQQPVLKQSSLIRGGYRNNGEAVLAIFSNDLPRARKLLTADGVSPDAEARAVMLSNLGELLRKEKQFPEAIKHFDQALRFSTDAGIVRQRGNMLLGRAKSHMANSMTQAGCQDAEAASSAAASAGELIAFRRSQLAIGACYCLLEYTAKGEALISNAERALRFGAYGAAQTEADEARSFCQSQDGGVTAPVAPVPSLIGFEVPQRQDGGSD